MRDYKSDENGTSRLNVKEWTALRILVTLIDSFEEDGSVLHRRAKLADPKAWNTLRLAEAWSMKAYETILKTIPPDQKVTVLTELSNTKLSVYAKAPVTGTPKGVVYCERDAFVRLVNHAIQLECLFCEKNRGESKRCQLRKDIQAVFPYSIDINEKDDQCVFAGLTQIPVQD